MTTVTAVAANGVLGSGYLEESLMAAVEAGADAFLLKPLEPLQLVSTVRDLLGSSAFLGPLPGAGS